jgi:hypothetical protein
MTNKSNESANMEAFSTATPEKKHEEHVEKASPTASNTTSHIVDDTEKWLGRSIIITGATGPKK